MNKKSEIYYFYPSFRHDREDGEVLSINSVINVIKENSDLLIEPVLGWPKLLEILQFSENNNILVVFRLDFLERKNMSVDEVLSMISALTKFISNKIIDIAVVVLKPCDKDLFTTLKRNGVLGIIPGLRFFGKEHSISAYINLQKGESHWPDIALEPELRRIEKKKKSIDLTDRQYEIFNLVARRGLSNKKIAEKLSISEETVKFHVGSILKKYGVRNRTQLALCNNTGTITLSH